MRNKFSDFVNFCFFASSQNSDVFALSMGCRSHKNWLVALLGLAGLSLLVTAVGLGHDFLGEDGERLATLLGAILISCGHIRNYMLCRRAACDR